MVHATRKQSALRPKQWHLPSSSDRLFTAPNASMDIFIVMGTSTAERLRLALEKDIFLLRLNPGDKLDETSLANRFGTSRTPVREALRQLSASGLVEIKAHRGAQVSRLSIPQLLEMFEFMAMLEGVCARFAAERASAEEIEIIREAHEACRPFVEARDADGFYDANTRFHEAIYRASHNSFGAQQTMFLRNRLGPYRRFQLRRNNRPAESFREHGQILDAISRGDATKAERIMHVHVNVQGSNFTALVSQVPPEYLNAPAGPDEARNV